jgi:hypothetical protein
LTLVGLGLLGAVLVTGCAKKYINQDGSHKAAVLLPEVADFRDLDGLDVPKGDPDDWKFFEVARDGVAFVRVDVGDLFAKRHGLTGGSITALDAMATRLARVAIEPDKQLYELDFEVTKGARYYLHLQATGGMSPYKVTLKVGDPKVDPCAACTIDQVCKQGQCVALRVPPPPQGCDPECGRGTFCSPGPGGQGGHCVKQRDRKEVCEAQCKRIYDVTRAYIELNWGHDQAEVDKRTAKYDQEVAPKRDQCTSECNSDVLDAACLSTISTVERIATCKDPCGGKCQRGEFCVESTGRCVNRNPCKDVTCSSNQTCKSGRCVDKPKPACDPPCKNGYTCNKSQGKCVAEPLGPISCVIIQVKPEGARSSLLINRGKQHKIVKGDTGSVPGVGRFTIRQVYPTRSLGVIDKPAASLASKKSCTVDRKGYKP